MFGYDCPNCKIEFNKILYFCEKYKIKSKRVYKLNLKQTCELIKQYEIDNKIKDGLFFAEPPELEHRLSRIRKVVDI